MPEEPPTEDLLPDDGLNEPALGEMMVRYQHADPAAAEDLVRRLSPVLLRFLASPNYSQSYCEDLLQQCWLRIHKARHSYRPGAPVLPWIYAIARHTRLDGYRRHRRIQSREISIEEHGDLPIWDNQAAAISGQDLFRLLDALPESQREVVLMLKVSGMSLEEVARATASTVGAVKQKAHRAYEALRRMLRPGPG